MPSVTRLTPPGVIFYADNQARHVKPAKASQKLRQLFETHQAYLASKALFAVATTAVVCRGVKSPLKPLILAESLLASAEATSTLTLDAYVKRTRPKQSQHSNTLQLTGINALTNAVGSTALVLTGVAHAHKRPSGKVLAGVFAANALLGVGEIACSKWLKGEPIL
jgi:hypothetical protein